MTPDRWKQISQLYEAAGARPVSERVAFLAEACAGDRSLQHEVQSLLDQPTSPALLKGFTTSALTRAIGDNAPPNLTGGRFGAYLLGEVIDSGGMGDVYRARDTKLGRDVAIKVLRQVFSDDAVRLARFEREARLLAALDHPHIGTIHGVEESDGTRVLVLALVEGDTLAERIARGPLPMAEALEYARQIADALQAAHDKGIVHRDLKPSNIKITPTGIVKVLDFGLAKAIEGSAREEMHPSATTPLPMASNPTITYAGAVLGTPAYMSPEQASGAEVDQRSDIWAFGVIVYEMLTGQRLFSGDSVPEIVAKVLEWEVIVDLPATTPPFIRRLIRRCLEKDRRRRLHHIADARLEIEDSLRGHDLDAVGGPTQLSVSRSPLASLQTDSASLPNGEPLIAMGQLLAPFLRVGSLSLIVMLVPAAFVVLGFLTSFTFNRALHIRTTEGPVDYLVFGYRAMVGPMATLLMFVAALVIVLAALSLLASAL